MLTRVRWLSLCALLLAAVSFAADPPPRPTKAKLNEFTPTENASGPHKNKLSTFVEKPENALPPENTPIPWKAISMTLLVFGIAIPIGLVQYRRTADEQEAVRAANLPTGPTRKAKADE